ncbi:MAG: MoaD/ThiS family protein [Clostridia bacterium]|nr:MoaD/ThiS family protein [Clostridia bacterium]MBR1827605.1 MoaD/ThiS family protein [Clostridia bacterium]
MAKVNVKVFGVYRVDSGVKEYIAEANIVNDVFTSLNYLSKVPDSDINFNNTAVFLNNKPCTKKKTKLKDGDEVWIMSPAGGG